MLLNEHEMELIKTIDHVRLDLRINALINEALDKPRFDLDRLKDLQALQSLLASSLVERAFVAK